jgi:hypothetical protein
MKGLIKPAFALAVILLALAELGAHLFFAQDISGRFDYGFSPDAGFRERGDGTVELFRAGGRRFHPQSFKQHRRPGVFRIFVVGDSVPRGPAFKEAYAWLLGEEFQKRGLQAEAVNLACPGYGVRRSQIVLRKIMAYEPSLIILHVNNNEYSDEREYRRSQEFQSWHPRNWPMKIFIFRRLYEAKLESVFWRLVPEKVRAKYALDDADAQVAASVDAGKTDEWMQRVGETTARSVALARQAQVPVLLITQARLEKAGNPAPALNDHDLDALARSLAGNGVFHVSMKEVFSPLPDLQVHFADSGHLRKSGHLILAQAIFHKIRQELGNDGFADVKPRPEGGGQAGARPLTAFSTAAPNPKKETSGP